MKNIVIFIPSIESGGVEKNLFYIINHIQYKFKRVFLVSVDKFKDKKLSKNIKLLSPSSKYYSNKSRIIKSLICFFIIVKNFWNKEILIFSLQSNFFSIVASKLINSKIILRLNTSPEKQSLYRIGIVASVPFCITGIYGIIFFIPTLILLSLGMVLKPKLMIRDK